MRLSWSFLHFLLFTGYFLFQIPGFILGPFYQSLKEMIQMSSCSHQLSCGLSGIKLFKFLVNYHISNESHWILNKDSKFREKRFLPTAYVVRGKVMLSVCSHLGGTPARSRQGRVPRPGPDKGGVYPSQVWQGGTPARSNRGVPWWGYPKGGYPDGGTPPHTG